jgi:hypothetical protein
MKDRIEQFETPIEAQVEALSLLVQKYRLTQKPSRWDNFRTIIPGSNNQETSDIRFPGEFKGLFTTIGTAKGLAEYEATIMAEVAVLQIELSRTIDRIHQGPDLPGGRMTQQRFERDRFRDSIKRKETQDLTTSVSIQRDLEISGDIVFAWFGKIREAGIRLGNSLYEPKYTAQHMTIEVNKNVQSLIEERAKDPELAKIDQWFVAQRSDQLSSKVAHFTPR